MFSSPDALGSSKQARNLFTSGFDLNLLGVISLSWPVCPDLSWSVLISQKNPLGVSLHFWVDWAAVALTVSLLIRGPFSRVLEHRLIVLIIFSHTTACQSS